MRDQLFANPQTLGDTVAHAKAVGVNEARFMVCLGESKFADEIRRDVTQATNAGIQGTPTFVLATTDASGALKVRRILQGAQPLATFKTQIDALLAEK